MILTLAQRSPDFYMSQYKAFENTLEKGAIAHNEQFLLFQQCLLPISINSEIVVCTHFQCGSLKFVVWERLKFQYK